jgi:hypothetical protein
LSSSLRSWWVHAKYNDARSLSGVANLDFHGSC